MPLFSRKKSNSNSNSIDKQQVFAVKRYKGKASKEKLLKINDEYITDDKDKPIIKLVNIKEIGFGKQSKAFSTNSKLDQKENGFFLTIYSKRANNIINLQIINKEDTPKFIEILLNKLKTINKIINKSDSEKLETWKDNNDQIFLIQIHDTNNEHDNEFKLKRYKEKGSKQKTIVLSDDGLVDDKGKTIIKYKNIDKIVIGKETKILKEHKHSSKKSHSIFFSLIDANKNVNIDFQVLNENDRFQIISKILNKLDCSDKIEMVQNYTGKDESLIIDILENEPLDDKQDDNKQDNDEQSDGKQDDDKQNHDKQDDDKPNDDKQDDEEQDDEQNDEEQESNNIESNNIESNDGPNYGPNDTGDTCNNKGDTDIKDTIIEEMIEKEIKKENEKHQICIKEMEKLHNEEINKLKNEYDLLQKKYNAEITTLKKKNEKLQKDLNDVKNKNKMMKGQQEKEKKLKTELQAMKRQSLSDKQEIDELKQELEISKEIKKEKENNDEILKMKAIRSNYIDNVKDVLSKSDWISFRKLMKFVANNSKILNENKYNQLVNSLIDIFASYPKCNQHLMLDFQILIPNESERVIFIKIMNQSLHQIENNNNKDNTNDANVLIECNDKIKKMEQEIKQQNEINISNHDIDQCDMILHGITNTYKIKLRLTTECLMIGNNEFNYNDIYKIEIGDTSLFQTSVDPKTCLVLLTSQGTIQLQAPSQIIRDKWLTTIQSRPNNKDTRISIENWNID